MASHLELSESVLIVFLVLLLYCESRTTP